VGDFPSVCIVQIASLAWVSGLFDGLGANVLLVAEPTKYIYRRFLRYMAQGKVRPDHECQLGSSVVHRGLGHSANMLRGIAPMAMPACIVTPVSSTPAGLGCIAEPLLWSHLGRGGVDPSFPHCCLLGEGVSVSLICRIRGMRGGMMAPPPHCQIPALEPSGEGWG